MKKRFEIQRFRSKEEAESYAKKLQSIDGENIPAVVRMLKDKSHQHANKSGNVPVIRRKNRTVSGWEFLYTDGYFRNAGWDGQLNV